MTVAVERAGDGASAGSCPTCGHARPGRYCGHCGEKRVEREDFTLRRIAGDAIATAFDLDSAVPRTLRDLVARPGRLTADYVAGRRRGRLGPFQLFFALNVVYFVVQSWTGWNSLRTPLYVHIANSPYGGLVRPLVERTVAARGIGLEEYAVAFDAMVDLQAKSLVILMVPLFALVVHAVCGVARRRYFAESIVFALHFIAFFLLLQSVLLPVVEAGRAIAARAGFVPTNTALDVALSATLAVTWLVYLWAAVRRVHAPGRWRAVAAALALVAGVVLVVFSFRMILFFTTYVLV